MDWLPTFFSTWNSSCRGSYTPGISWECRLAPLPHSHFVPRPGPGRGPRATVSGRSVSSPRTHCSGLTRAEEPERVCCLCSPTRSYVFPAGPGSVPATSPQEPPWTPVGPASRAWAVNCPLRSPRGLVLMGQLSTGSGTSQASLFPASEPLRQNVPLAQPSAHGGLGRRP